MARPATFDLELTTVNAYCETDEMVVYYNYVTAQGGQTLIVVHFYAEPNDGGGTTVETVQAVIVARHPGHTIILTDTANTEN